MPTAGEYAGNIFWIVAFALAGDHQIFLDRERGKDGARFLHEGESRPRDSMGLHPREILPVERHLAAARRRDAHDGAQGRGLPRAIAAQQRDNLARPRLQRDALKDMALAQIGLDIVNPQQGLHDHDAPAGLAAAPPR